MNETKRLILQTKRLSEEELDKKVNEYVASGKALNTQGALNLVKREIQTEKVRDNETINGYLMAVYRNKQGVNKMYVLRDSAVMTPVILLAETKEPETEINAPGPVKITGCVLYKNIFTDYQTYETSGETIISKGEIKTPLVDCCPVFSKVAKNGVFALRGVISKVYVDRDESRSAPGTAYRDLPFKPILEAGGRVNLKLVLEDGTSDASMSVRVSDEDRLGMLLGRDDMAFLDADDAYFKLSDALRGMHVIVFGRRSDEIDGKKTKNPFMNLHPFGFIVPQEQDPAVDVKTAVPADAEEE